MNAVQEERVFIKKHYSQYDLGKLKIVREYGGWNSFPEHERLKLLWELGINTQRKVPYKEVLCKHRTQQSNSVVEGLQIYGEERLDPEWINKRVDGYRVASLEAQIAAKQDPSLYREIKRIANGRGL